MARGIVFNLAEFANDVFNINCRFLNWVFWSKIIRAADPTRNFGSFFFLVVRLMKGRMDGEALMAKERESERYK